MDDMFSPEPYEYFSSVAGPSLNDVAGPPLSVLDVFSDGTPVAEAQARVANSVGGGAHAHWWNRGDVQAFGLTLLGAAMIHAYSNS